MQFVNLRLTQAQMQVVNAGLQELPWKIANDVLVAIHNEIRAQEAYAQQKEKEAIETEKAAKKENKMKTNGVGEHSVSPSVDLKRIPRASPTVPSSKF